MNAVLFKKYTDSYDIMYALPQLLLRIACLSPPANSAECTFLPSKPIFCVFKRSNTTSDLLLERQSSAPCKAFTHHASFQVKMSLDEE